MDTIEQLQQQRNLLVQQMLEITCTTKGTISKQYVPSRKEGKPTERLLGPYWVLTTKKKGKTVSERLTSKQAVDRRREEIVNHKRLSELFQRFEELTQGMGTLLWEANAPEETLKKRPKSRLKKIGKLYE